MRYFLVALVTVGALVVCLLRVVHERHQNVALGYAIARATTEQRGLEDELERLRIDRAALLDPARLEPLAGKRGLRMPSPDEVVLVQAAEPAHVP